MVKELISNYKINENEIKFFTGYSGWTPNQLDGELNENSWIVVEKCSAETIFSHSEQTMWKDVVKSLGQRYAHIANFPENPQLN
jgi:putative transcriptional regulator